MGNSQPTEHNNLPLKPFPIEVASPLGPEIFKNKVNRANPASEVWGREHNAGGGTVTYVPIKIESRQNEGNFVYYHGCPFPSKTYAPPEAIYAIAPVKRKLINYIKILAMKELRLSVLMAFLWGKKSRGRIITKILQLFNEEADLNIKPYLLQEGLYCTVVKEIQKGIQAFLISLQVGKEESQYTSEVIGAMFEYDNAYRVPLQDLLDSANKSTLLTNFPKEVKRLLQLNRERTPNVNASVPGKMKTAAKLLKYAWYMPSLRKAIKAGINAMDWEKVRLDEADIYHNLLYDSYNLRGYSLAEKMLIYRNYHGEDMSKWPPRVIVRNKE